MACLRGAPSRTRTHTHSALPSPQQVLRVLFLDSLHPRVSILSTPRGSGGAGTRPCHAVQIARGDTELLSRRISEGDFTTTFELLNLIFHSELVARRWGRRAAPARLIRFRHEHVRASGLFTRTPRRGARLRRTLCVACGRWRGAPVGLVVLRPVDERPAARSAGPDPGRFVRSAGA